MDTEQFDQYVTSEINSGTNMSAKATYTNVRIAANTNPKFTKQITLNGVIIIETPNVVEFAGGVDITGIIVGKGSDEDDGNAIAVVHNEASSFAVASSRGLNA